MIYISYRNNAVNVGWTGTSFFCHHFVPPSVSGGHEDDNGVGSSEYTSLLVQICTDLKTARFATGLNGIVFGNVFEAKLSSFLSNQDLPYFVSVTVIIRVQ